MLWRLACKENAEPWQGLPAACGWIESCLENSCEITTSTSSPWIAEKPMTRNLPPIGGVILTFGSDVEAGA